MTKKHREAVITATSIITKKKVVMKMKKPVLAFAVTFFGMTLALALGKVTKK